MVTLDKVLGQHGEEVEGDAVHAKINMKKEGRDGSGDLFGTLSSSTLSSGGRCSFCLFAQPTPPLVSVSKHQAGDSFDHPHRGRTTPLTD